MDPSFAQQTGAKAGDGDAIQNHVIHLNLAKKIGDKAGEGNAYENLGICYRSLGQYEKAIQHHEMHMNIAKQIGDKPGEGKAYNNLGSCFYSLDQYEKAIEHHEMWLNIVKQIGDKSGEGMAYGNLGNCFESLGQYEKAIQHYEMCLKIVKQIGHKSEEGITYNNLGNCFHSLGQYEKAIQHYEMCLNIGKQIGDKSGEGMAYSKLGNCFHSLGQYEKEIRYHKMHLNIAKQIGDKLGEGAAYGNLGDCFLTIGQYEKAIQHLQMCLNTAKQIGDKLGEGAAYGNLGDCFHSLGQYKKAIQHLEMCLNIAKHIGGKSLEGAAYNSLGVCFHSLGQYEKAIRYHEMCLNIAKQTGDKLREGAAYSSLGACFYFLGQYEKAIRYHEMCLNIAKQIGRKSGEGAAYSNLGACFYSFGLYEKAIRYHEMCLNIAKQIGNKSGEGAAYNNLGACFYSLGQYDKAIRYYEMCLNIAKQIGDKPGEGAAYDNLGVCFHSLGQYEKAIRYHEMCLNIAKQIGHKSVEGKTYGHLGACFDSLGQYQKAIQHHEISLDIAKQSGGKPEEKRAYANLGVCFASLGQYDKAEMNLVQSLSYHENLVENTPNKDEYLISIQDNFVPVFKTFLRTLLIQGKTKQALVIAERGRSRALTELMRTSYSIHCAEITRSNMFDFSEIQKLVTGFGICVLYFLLYNNAICTWVIQPNGDVTLKHIKHGIAMPDLKNLIWKARMAQRNPCAVKCEDRSLAFLYSGEFVEQTQNKLVTVLSDVAVFKTKKLLDSLPSVAIEKESKSMTETLCPNKVRQRNIFEEEAGEGGDTGETTLDNSDELVEQTQKKLASALPFVTTPEGVAIVKESKLITQTSSSHNTATERNIFEEEEREHEGPLNRLYQIVMDPVRELIEGSQILVVPEGELYLVPFSALKDDEGKYVAESLQVRLVPSLSTAKMMSEYPQQLETATRPLIVGDPDAGPASRLPFAGEEAREIGRLLNVEPLTGKNATKENVLRQLENANLIHIAAHGDRQRGAIVLAINHEVHERKTKLQKEDFMLMMSDLEDKCLRAKLVVLSCCHSARGEVKSEGVIGIARAFLGAGARSVLMALWAIDDEATMCFMKSFYEHLKCGKTASESLNKAMKALREMAQFRKPEYWAPFVLVGDDVTIF